MWSPLKSPSSSLSSSMLNTSGLASPEHSSDRYIPLREPNKWNLRFNMIKENEKSNSIKVKNKHNTPGDNNNNNSNNNNIDCSNVVSPSSNGSFDVLKNGLAYQCLLKNELLGAEIEDINEYQYLETKKLSTPLRNRNVFRFRSKEIRSEPTSPYSLSPISQKSQKMLRSPRKITRKISKIPFKILDAPSLQDDFYLNLVDWSSTNILSVGLGDCVYLWSACTSQVTRLCDFPSGNNAVTSVSWSERGNYVAVGNQSGIVQIWDATTLKCIRQLEGHKARVGCLAWNSDSLCSGSRDRNILQRDIRSPAIFPDRRLVSHKQEVCGLKWSPDNHLLASGGNDNRIYIWNVNSNQPIQAYTEHTAAVKAIAWSPHHHGLLASGGGTADRCIRFWNTLTGQPMQSIDTGSQVCNLAWSKHAHELVSTHGYSQHQILVWKYPSLAQVAKLTGHTYRVLYLAMSPDGESIVTGAGDETLRFWNVFSKARSQKEAKSALDLFSSIR